MKTNKFFISAIALGVVFTAFTACSEDDATLPPIDGYNNAGEIAATDLVAYWPLDGTGKESISNAMPATTVGTTWVDGIKGRAAKMDAGYMTYPEIAALTQTMNAFTISAWVNVKNNQTEVEGSGSVSTFFSMKQSADWQGGIMLFAETGQLRPVNAQGAVNDSIKVKAGWASTANGSQIYENWLHLEPWMVEDNVLTPGKHVAGPNVIGGRWAQLVFTWDGATNKFIIYSNGAKISNPAFEVRGDNTSVLFDPGSIPTIGAFGNVATTTDSWNKPLTGQLDEIRIWKKALAPGDINSLYELEKVGR